MGEMVFVRHLFKGDPQGRGRGSAAHRQRAFFGVQIATNCEEEGRKAIALAAEEGAD